MSTVDPDTPIPVPDIPGDAQPVVPTGAEALWEHWDRCALHWFPGNHIVHVSQPEYLRRMIGFLRPFMF